MIEKFEERLRTYAKKWLSAIDEHEDSVANFEMSPESFFEIWQNKDSYTQPRKHLKIDLGAGIVRYISATIRNHFSNRPPNWSKLAKKKEKINYFFGIVSYAREYNFLPISSPRHAPPMPPAYTQHHLAV